MEKEPCQIDSDAAQTSGAKSAPTTPRVNTLKSEDSIKIEDINGNIWKKIVPSDLNEYQEEKDKKNVPASCQDLKKSRPDTSTSLNTRGIKRRSSFGGPIGVYRDKADQPKLSPRRISKPNTPPKNNVVRQNDMPKLPTGVPQTFKTITSPGRKLNTLYGQRKRSEGSNSHIRSTSPMKFRTEFEALVNSQSSTSKVEPDSVPLETSEEYSTELKSTGTLMSLTFAVDLVYILP